MIIIIATQHIIIKTKHENKQQDRCYSFFPSISLCKKYVNCLLDYVIRWCKKIKSPHDDAKLQRACGQHIFPFFFSLSLYYTTTATECIRLSHDIDFQHKKHPPPARHLCQASKQVQRKNDERKSLLSSVKCRQGLYSPLMQLLLIIYHGVGIRSFKLLSFLSKSRHFSSFLSSSSISLPLQCNAWSPFPSRFQNRPIFLALLLLLLLDRVECCITSIAPLPQKITAAERKSHLDGKVALTLYYYHQYINFVFPQFQDDIRILSFIGKYYLSSRLFLSLPPQSILQVAFVIFLELASSSTIILTKTSKPAFAVCYHYSSYYYYPPDP